VPGIAVEKCEPVPQKAQHAAQVLLSHPHKFNYYIPDVSDNAEKQLIAKREVAAERYGLTIYDYRTEFRNLEHDLYAKGGQKVPVSEYLEAAQDFSAKYGIKLSVPQKVPANPYGIQTEAMDLNTLDAKQQEEMRFALYGFIENLGELPVEFVQTTGLKNVYVVKIDDKDTAGFADYINGGKFFVDGTKPLDGETFTHELTHLWDADLCGNSEAIFHDPGFNKLNPSNIYSQYPGSFTKTDRQGYKSYDSVVQSKRASTLSQKNKLSAYFRLFRKVVVTEDYSFTNVAEDKATLGQELFSPYDYRSIYNKHQPILASKFAYLLARLYQKSPNIARYFVEVGNNTFF
jgi:hypothetical protein